MYLRLPLSTATAGYNRSAALWISMFAFTLMPSETACSVWNQERAVVGHRTSPRSLLAPQLAGLPCTCTPCCSVWEPGARCGGSPYLSALHFDHVWLQCCRHGAEHPSFIDGCVDLDIVGGAPVSAAWSPLCAQQAGPASACLAAWKLVPRTPSTTPLHAQLLSSWQGALRSVR